MKLLYGAVSPFVRKVMVTRREWVWRAWGWRRLWRRDADGVVAWRDPMGRLQA